MVSEKLAVESATIAAEGWKWIEVAPEFAYGHNFDLRQLRSQPVALTAEEEAARNAFQNEYNQLSDAYSTAD